jgi:DNA-binding transcriptional ArsR family regulator
MRSEGNVRLDELERRVAALEVAAWARDDSRTAAAPDLAALDELRRKDGPRYARGELRGAVTFAGSAEFGDRKLLWAGEHGLPEIVDLDHDAMARLFTALGHPARLALVRALLAGDRTSAGLQEVIGTASAGQLYHHLKDLIAAGVAEQAGRSRYRISNARIVPLLVVLAAAGDVARPQEAALVNPADDSATGTPSKETHR